MSVSKYMTGLGLADQAVHFYSTYWITAPPFPETAANRIILAVLVPSIRLPHCPQWGEVRQR